MIVAYVMFVVHRVLTLMGVCDRWVEAACIPVVVVAGAAVVVGAVVVGADVVVAAAVAFVVFDAVAVVAAGGAAAAGDVAAAVAFHLNEGATDRRSSLMEVVAALVDLLVVPCQLHDHHAWLFDPDMTLCHYMLIYYPVA